jgi:rubredoxin
MGYVRWFCHLCGWTHETELETEITGSSGSRWPEEPISLRRPVKKVVLETILAR